MKVQRRPTRRNYQGEAVRWTYWVIVPKQVMLDLMEFAGTKYWARAYDDYTLGIWPGERPYGITRPVRVRRIAYCKNGRHQASYAMTIPVAFTNDFKPNMTAKCQYGGDHLKIAFEEPVFEAYVETQREQFR